MENKLGKKMQGGWMTNERPGTDHVMSGPMRGLQKNCTRWRGTTEPHPDRHGDFMTESAQWSRFSEKIYKIKYFQKQGNNSLEET